MKGVKEITEQLLTGAVIADVLDDLATLRLDIFREYPYLYEGRREDELNGTSGTQESQTRFRSGKQFH